MNIERRWKYFTAMALIGDGVMALTVPRHDARVWHLGPKGWQRLMGWFRKHPTVTRTMGAAEVAAGILWALRMNEED